MASRRLLKKNVNYIIGELFVECLISSTGASKVDEKQVDLVLTDILNVQDDFISRISHTEPGNVKAFYKKFYQDFNEATNRIVEAIEKLR